MKRLIEKVAKKVLAKKKEKELDHQVINDKDYLKFDGFA